MRALVCSWVACLGVVSSSGALAGPPSAAQAKYRAAVQLVNTGSADQALAVIDEGLAAAPRDLALLGLKGRVLLALRDYAGALAAYEIYLDSGVTGANRRQAQQIVRSLSAVRTTFVDITLANGPATIYLDSRTLGAFCTAAPACRRPILPGEYKVIAERAGFVIWTGRLAAAADTTTELAITLTEKPSRLTVRATPAGAQVTVDGAALGAPADVAPGTHRVVVALAGHREARLDAAAHEGKPITLDVALVPVAAVRVEPAGASLVLDGKPVLLEAGSLALPAGEHELVARAAGYRDRSVQIPAALPAGYAIALELERIPPAGPRAPGRAGLTRRRTAAVAVATAGLGATAAALILATQSRHYEEEAFALCESPAVACRFAAEANRRYEIGRTRAIEADVAFGVAGAAAIGALVLWFTGAPEARAAVPRVTAVPRVGPVAGLDLVGTF